MARTPSHTSQKDMAAVVNNALLQARKLLYFQEFERDHGSPKLEKRMGRLRVYMEGLMEAPIEHLNEEILKPEEAVYILLAAAVVVAGTRFRNVGKLPAFLDLAARISEETDSE